MKKDLAIRLFDFAVSAINLIRKFPKSPEYQVISYQLCKSATSSGANYEEAQAGSSKQDFIYKTEISLREMKESNYWLRIIREIKEESLQERERLNELIGESEELSKILAAIIVRSKENVEASR
ncbi:MAG: four helix bundle protein [Chlorobium sp.]|uniref:Four helix bundle protein n=1 Tax=Chlorobium phaeobacteroides (strain BS1) TaxID=331678 RepID=B3ELW9_CHLPB|nr:four helix bundle protein [Chlorobium phaeobacteroides]MCW8815488.1 four helix bundle protein [Chlorobium sp.]